jgi:hypothetical protein
MVFTITGFYTDNKGMVHHVFPPKGGPLVLCLFLACLASAQGQDLSLGPADFRIEQLADGGFHLFIRKKPNIASVLLTESTRDPLYRENNYAYRSLDWNAVNGNENRILDGALIPPEAELWSLIDSTPEAHSELGQAFHIFIPWILRYGSDNTRHGEVYVTHGTYFNVRAFALPYADYRGPFRDNPYILEVNQQPLSGPAEGNYMKETLEAFTAISRNGLLEKSAGPADLTDKIKKILREERGKEVDIVFCLDTTGSMKDDIAAIRELLVPMMQNILGEFRSFRIGMVLYKDYYDEYLTRVIPFTRDFAAFQRTLNGIKTGGGRDIPEAVYEALYDGAVKFNWEAESRLIILIGDAPPHLRQKGKVSEEMVNEEIAARNIKVNAIILPQ